MCDNIFSRTELLIGKEGLAKLKNAHVAIFGIGGVGSFVAEGLARSGVEKFTFIDYDEIDITNINRQIIATTETVGEKKVDLMAKRVKSINPEITVIKVDKKYLPETSEEIFNDSWDYVVDAVDMVTAKLDIICKCKEKNISVISSMGTGNKLDPTRFEISDIYKTSVCPLAKVMRRELRKRNIESLKVLYSKEEPIIRELLPGSIAFVPSVAGLIIASEVVKDIISNY